jgi:competence protein ComEC
MAVRDLLATRENKAVFLAALIALGLWAWALMPHSRAMTVTFLDVGEGDAAVVRAPGGETALIDAGSEQSGKRAVLPYLRRLGVSAIDVIVVTHPHEDHAGGMPAVLEALDTGMLVGCGEAHDSPGYRRLLQIARKRGVPYHKARRGDEMKLGEVTMEVLGPPPYGSGAELNDRSVVLRIRYGKSAVLMCADAGPEAQEEMIGHCPELLCDVMKTPHHGAEDSLSAGFLEAVRPKAVVISVGSNDFGHPSAKTLDRLERAGARVYRTDRCGAVTIESSGDGLRVTTCRSPK